MISFQPKTSFNKDATFILVSKEQLETNKFSFHEKSISDHIKQINSLGQFSADVGESYGFVLNKKIIVLVGVGKKSENSLTSLRISLRKAFFGANLKKVQTIEIVPVEDQEAAVRAVIESILIGTYVWNKYKSKPSEKLADKSWTIVATKKSSYEQAIKVCEGVNLTRNLINDNADYITSEYLEKTIRGLIKGKKNISIEVLGEKEMKKKGLGLHLAVNQASVNPPKLVIVKYTGLSKKDPYEAFIGKGMTFDTGGLNLKPTGSIETMRSDMSGAAAVIGTLKNVIALNVKKNILFVCSIAENVTDAKSYKPGDVIRSFSGKTVEIGNTDAEGRLVLADAFSYVIKNYKPKAIIDIATLTGACSVALANDYAALVTTDDKFARELVHTSNETDDRIWRLPSYPELKDAVKSQIADIRNLGFAKGAGGTITAAEFLRQFTEGTRWAHLDIANTAFVDGAGRWYYGQGATGFGVRLMTYYFMNC